MKPYMVDGYLAPVLVPTIMSINLYHLYINQKPDLFYSTISLGIILSAISSLFQFHLKRHIRSRRALTILTATLLTMISMISIIGFNFIRINLTPYEIPTAVKNQIISDGSAVFRYHFYSDFIPGVIILSQTQLCAMIVNDLLCKAKRSFSLGEASIIAQLASGSYLVWALTIYSRYSGAGPFQVHLTTDIVLNISVIVFALMFMPSYLFLKGKATIKRYSLIGLTVAASYAQTQSLISSSSKLDPLTWLISHIFSTHFKINLFCLWVATLTACVSFSTSWTVMVGHTNSLVRKVFHLAICVVFISGYNQDVNFTRFAAGGFVIVMIILEMIRAWQLEPIGPHLEKVCQAMRGKWDNKYLTLSHVYLLVGTFLPLWLQAEENQNKLALSCGLISVGVGDTAAAIVGTFYGKRRLGEKSSKTVEGLLGNIASMILFKLIWIGYSGVLEEFSFIIIASLTALIEALTNSCDNLILPLVMILFLQVF